MVVVRIRQPVPSDGPGIGRVHVRAWQSAYAEVMPASFLRRLDENERGHAWEERLAEHQSVAASKLGIEPEIRFLVAESSPSPEWRPDTCQIVGVATIGPERNPTDHRLQRRGELWMINVLPAVWRTGVGSALLWSATDQLAELGYDEAVLWVVDANTRARAFYERHGWAPDGAHKLEWFGGHDVYEIRYAAPIGQRRALRRQPAIGGLAPGDSDRPSPTTDR